MKILFLCGVFAKEKEQEIIKFSKRPIEFSANEMQKKIIHGFRQCECDLNIISAPFIGSYPNASKQIKFKGFDDFKQKSRFVSFNNIWGVRNFSRTRSLKKAVRTFSELREHNKMIVVYSPHTPLLEAAMYAKKKDSTIKICLIVPDLPQYMNLNASISALYKLCKYIDIHRFQQLNKNVDTYMLLTEKMKEKMAIDGKPYIVVEGIASETVVIDKKKNNVIKNIVYTGKMNEKFGVKNLVDAFCKMKNENYRLVLCGKGDLESYITNKCKEDSRIVYKGQVTPEEAKKQIYEADVLVNPRQNNEEYTKYSFPSKNIEYLLSGNPVVAYMLDGIPSVYTTFMYVVSENSLEALSCTIEKALNDVEEKQKEKKIMAHQYLKTITEKEVACKIIALNDSEGRNYGEFIR